MKNYLLAGYAVLALFSTGCSSDMGDAGIRNGDTETSAIKIVLQSEYPSGRGAETDALANEAAIKNYTAGVRL